MVTFKKKEVFYLNNLLINDWKGLLEDEMKKKYYLSIEESLRDEYSKYTIYPHKEDIFKALNITAYKDVKVVILGQDPYHGPDQACGLSFSVKAGIKIPPSLRNIYKELEADLGFRLPNHGDLTKWGKEGVLLLNTSLTVRRGEANSHSKIGWQIFTDNIIKILNERVDPVVFILWGNNAIKKESLIESSRHFIIKSVHPSPLSANRGFFGSKPFSKTNEILKSIGKDTIDWHLENI